jgi:predicted ribosome quality control (RQC) complex YloA/Tae2 family protein
MDHKRRAVSRLVLRRLARKRRAIAKVEAEIADSQNADEHRMKGQLILARKGDIPRGARVARLKDFDESSTIEVAINPSLSPIQNAESYFKRAKKAEKRAAKAPARLGELEAEAESLEAVGSSIPDASVERLGEIEERFGTKIAAGPRGALKSRGKTAPPRAHFRTYVVSGGWEVLVGRTNKDNDVLTHRIANQNDLWFHARQAAGSHVILRIPSGKARPDRRAILEAAAIAAFHSKAGRSSKVSVSYTEKRHVRKPRGAKPGLAVISREKTVMVRPQIPQT